MESEHNQANTESYLEELREEYKEFPLSDDQIVQAKSVGLTPQNIKVIIEAWNKISTNLTEIFETITLALQKSFTNEEVRKFIESLRPYENTVIPEPKEMKFNKKGKQLKPWQNKKFYQ